MPINIRASFVIDNSVGQGTFLSKCIGSSYFITPSKQNTLGNLSQATINKYYEGKGNIK